MNPNLMEQFLGPSTQFFRFNSNDINVVVTPIDKKTCLLTKRNVIATTVPTSNLNNSSYSNCNTNTINNKYNSTSNSTKNGGVNNKLNYTTSSSSNTKLNKNKSLTKVKNYKKDSNSNNDSDNTYNDSDNEIVLSNNNLKPKNDDIEVSLNTTYDQINSESLDDDSSNDQNDDDHCKFAFFYIFIWVNL